MRGLRREITVTGDEELERLYAELAGYPHVEVDQRSAEIPRAAEIVLPLRLRRGGRGFSFFSTISVFGTALDVTLAELTIEAFYPADHETASALLEHGASGPLQ